MGNVCRLYGFTICSSSTQILPNLALSTSTFVLAMNKPAYDRLPAELKTVIDGNSGVEVAGMAGAMWDAEARIVVDMVRERGDPITLLPEDQVALWGGDPAGGFALAHRR